MIVNAFIKDISPQIDGRKYITEVQVDDQLGELVFFYLAEVGMDVDAVMTARTVELNTNGDAEG